MRKTGKDSSLSRSLQTPPYSHFSFTSSLSSYPDWGFQGFHRHNLNMVVSGNYWEVIANDVLAYEDLDNLLNLLDVEELDGDDFVGDWDIPIPSDVPLGPVKSTCEIVAEVVPKPIVADAEQKQVSNYGDGPSSHTPQQNKFVEITQEPGKLETQSPVSVLENSGSCLTGKSLPIKFCNATSVRARSKRVRPSGSNPWLSILPWFTSASTFKTTSHAKKDKGSQKRLHLSIAAQSRNKTPRKFEPQCTIITKECTHCEVTNTPQWREGPLGPKTLCNACGVRFRSGRLFPEYRPVASPTFIPSLHSNSHRKVMEMRMKMKQQELEIGELCHHHNLNLSQ